ncbi:hypothetical protein Ahy_B09g095067 [Arachis hypogaea]|uniref:non-specific serine/threonine protein kinase n=1 Tax=Arachis hypogaea TaxID=3818 RepID=A0A444XD03_ARAHY|nr:hypothetical protein Ahy_B09g095067 [Arachis hypogaea]
MSGFISIDCGLPENSNYTEKNIGINYISDANFIDSGVSKTVSPQDNGVSKTVSPQDKTTHPQYFNYLRSFPNGIRNCYRINVTSVTRYLIRASFLYGNYDGLNKLPEFDLYLGVHFWETVKFTNSSVSINYEIIHTLSLNYIHICLVNKGTGTPFISVIEMRILGNVEKSYVTIESSTSLARFRRLYFSSISNLIYRYEDDPYNRIWEPYWENNWRLISSNHSNYALDQDPFNPPAVVLKTAATSINATASLDFHWDIDDNETQHQYYFYLHFTELQHLGADQTRSFNINMDGKTWNTLESLKYGKVYTKHVRGLSSGCKNQKSTKTTRMQSQTSRRLIGWTVETGKEIHVFPDAYKWQGVDCSTIDGFLRITSLNLSSSGLTGHIRTDISKLTMLKDLSDNGLSGNIPNFLVQLQSLEYLNLAHNNLTAGSVSNELLQKQSDGQLTLSVRQNPNLLCGTTSCTLQTNATRKKKNNAVITVVASIAGILLLLGIAAVIIVRRKKTYDAAKNIMLGWRHNPIKESELENKQREYSFNEVVNMTNNFDRILGRGGFGTVYHGFIEDIEVAVKMLSLSSVKLLMRVHHRNLTSLIGYCNEETNIGLIYEYMKNGDLDEHLSGKNNRGKSLNWEDRLRIAVDAAQGLEYLHNGCKPPIIHRDVKCPNILLNENFHAKLADFGLSKCFAAEGDTHVSTIVAGTPGYLDPEYTTSNRLTEKSDVYSFGVVLLRIITGQSVIIIKKDTTHHIIERVNSMIAEGDITKVVDSRLQGDFDNNSAWKAVEIAMASVSSTSVKRPYMRDVVTQLKDCLAAELARKHNICNLQNEDSVEEFSVNLISTDMTPSAR